MNQPLPRTPQKSPQFRPQPGESPMANFGRYGLYRALLREQNPTMRPDDPVVQQLMLQNKRAKI